MKNFGVGKKMIMKKKNKKEKKKEVAIKVENVSKTFRIPHEKIDSVRSAFVGALKQRTFEEFKALDNVSFEIKKGEFFGIIGRNGGGKSTLLKILAGIYRPDKGKIKINGKISPFLELGIGFNPELSGRDNIYLNATVLGLSKKQIDEKFDDIVAFSELERFIDQKLKNYSSGMQVRLAFSVSIHANRDILLMDEVLAVGDNNFQSKCLEEFSKYRDLGKTVVLVSHDISTIQKYCDRAMLLRKGKIKIIGDPEIVGNKYIFQNMSDEEKRILKRTKANRVVKDGETTIERIRHIKRSVEIVKAEFFNKEGKKKNTFKTDEYMEIRIYFKNNQQNIWRKNLNIGIGLYRDDRSYIFGYNTEMDRYSISINTNKVSLIFEKMPLLCGNYYINVVCFENNEEKFIDFKEKVNEFKMFSSTKTNKYRGILNINHKWK